MLAGWPYNFISADVCKEAWTDYGNGKCSLWLSPRSENAAVFTARQNHRCVSHRTEAERFVPTPGQVFYYRKKARHPWATGLEIYKLMHMLAILKLLPFQPGRVAQSGNKATATVASSRSLSWNAIADQVVLGPGNATQNFPGTAHGHTVQVSRPASGLTICNCTC